METAHQLAYDQLCADDEQLDRYARAIARRLQLDYLSALRWLRLTYDRGDVELVHGVIDDALPPGTIVPGIDEATAWRREAGARETERTVVPCPRGRD